MNRDEGQYQLTHIFDEFLGKPGSKSPGKGAGNSTLATSGSVAGAQRQ